MGSNFVTGLDLGSSSIKAVILSHGGKLPRLYSFGSIATPSPGLNSENENDWEGVAKSIKALLSSIKNPSSSVVIALPESKTFTRVIDDLPFLTDEELAASIKYSAEEFVPLPTDQVNLYWQVIDRSKQKNRTMVFVVASPKNTVNRYLKVLDFAGVKPHALETELIAVSRSLVGINPFAPTTLIVQMGASSTDFAVISRGMILLTRSIATGGTSLTRAIAQYLNFEIKQAEEYKKSYGLLPEQLEGKIFQVLKPLVDLIVAEAGRVIQSFQTKYPQNKVKRLVLTGGGSKLPGLVVYFANSLGLETQEADPWTFVDKDQSILTKLTSEGPYYSIAVGLAMREE